MTATVPEYFHVKTLEVALGVGRSTLREYNPALRDSVWTGRKYVPQNFQLRLPIIHVDSDVRSTFTNIPSNQRFAKQKRDRHHRVRRGDTLSGIAAQYNTRVAALVSLNGINGKHLIYAGQRLVLPTTEKAHVHTKSVTRESIPNDGEYVVRRGDSIYRITQRFGVDEPTLLALNPLRNRHKLEIGQVLRLKAANLDEAGNLVLAEAKPTQVQDDSGPPGKTTTMLRETHSQKLENSEELDENVLATAQVTLSADPSDYTVASDQTIEVHALETLGYYAEWLGIRTQTLRIINNMDFGEHVVSGTRLKVDFSHVSEGIFESRRLSYHQDLQEKFFHQFRIRDTHPHIVRRGESIWLLAQRKYHVPVWLLRQYNPDLDFHRVSSGAQVNIPVLEQVTETPG
jgi:membrane-bound lytic murein transglycosylase D